jgi:putative DNA primase/helicase
LLTAIVGRDNVAAPTLAALSSNFGLEPLIGKQLAIISDARLGGRTDQAAISERLLSISGEDTITIDRKFRAAWTGRLTTRFMLLTNELPRLTDASGALTGRFIVLNLENSFYGREDPSLTDRLLSELPAILNWSLDGYQRMHSRGYFVQPTSARETIEALETLSSPITAFVRERCRLEPGATVSVAILYTAWRDWCAANGRREPGTIQIFARDLTAAFPAVRRTRPRDGESRHRAYEGIDLI